MVNLVALDEGLGQWFASHDYATVERKLEDAGVPFSKIFTIADIEQDPHYQGRKAIIRLPDPDYGTLPAPCVVPRVPGRELAVPRTGPDTGEHNAQVYGEFGLDAAALDALRADKVI